MPVDRSSDFQTLNVALLRCILMIALHYTMHIQWHAANNSVHRFEWVNHGHSLIWDIHKTEAYVIHDLRYAIEGNFDDIQDNFSKIF